MEEVSCEKGSQVYVAPVSIGSVAPRPQILIEATSARSVGGIVCKVCKDDSGAAVLRLMSGGEAGPIFVVVVMKFHARSARVPEGEGNKKKQGNVGERHRTTKGTTTVSLEAREMLEAPPEKISGK